MSLSRRKRDYYLHSLGIQPWSVRLPIQKRTYDAEKLNKTVAHQQTDHKIKPPARLLVEKPRPQKNEEQELLKTQDVMRFNLAFLMFSDLLIISELPLHDHNTVTSAQLRLVKSIRLSLGYPANEPEQVLMMNWPLVENNKINHSEEAAFEAVQAQLKKQMEKYQPRYLLIMGATACHYVLRLNKTFEELRGQLVANEFSCATVTYSITELLKVSSLKSSAWKDLQVIRRLPA